MQIWEADLVSLIPIAPENNGFKFILTVIDVLSRHAWAEPLKNKSANETARGFAEIIKRSGRICVKLHTDNGDYKIKHINFFTMSTNIKINITHRKCTCFCREGVLQCKT